LDSLLDKDQLKITKNERCADERLWPGAGSNRRPSDFQELG
jgi:hypothetical protein